MCRKGENDCAEGGGGIRIPVPGSSVRCGATPKDDGRRKRGGKPKDDGKGGECRKGGKWVKKRSRGNLLLRWDTVCI
jgi:hypothetical protein